MFKNVSLRKRNVNGHPTWVLLGPDAELIPAFSAFAHALRNDATNTLDSYVRHLAEFLDYLIEVSVIHEGHITKLNLSEAIEAYVDYLQSGVDARREIARRVAVQLPPGVNSAASLGPKIAAIRRFLRLSEDVRNEMAELARCKGEVKVSVDSDLLLPGLGERRELRSFEVRAMQANSMFAGVIAGGPKFINCIVLDGHVGDIPYEQSRAFPYDKAMELIDSMPTFRDKALYALLTASGCRTHEALQLLMEDINVIEGTVRLVQPKLRTGHASYRALPAEVRKSMA